MVGGERRPNEEVAEDPIADSGPRVQRDSLCVEPRCGEVHVNTRIGGTPHELPGAPQVRIALHLKSPGGHDARVRLQCGRSRYRGLPNHGSFQLCPSRPHSSSAGV
mmetsp:Transcript_3113/g.5136  ORF Transcript_3113/g.5136 Transcript_3113/m.5136 type:complete len:106 (-) Transcript_3113:241-558(-)